MSSGKYPEAETVRAVMETRSRLQKLEKKHPKRSALLRLRLLEAQSDYRDTLVTEAEFRDRVADISERAGESKTDEVPV
jgi:hypothetical protein